MTHLSICEETGRLIVSDDYIRHFFDILDEGSYPVFFTIQVGNILSQSNPESQKFSKNVFDSHIRKVIQFTVMFLDRLVAAFPHHESFNRFDKRNLNIAMEVHSFPRIQFVESPETKFFLKDFFNVYLEPLCKKIATRQSEALEKLLGSKSLTNRRNDEINIFEFYYL